MLRTTSIRRRAAWALASGVLVLMLHGCGEDPTEMLSGPKSSPEGVEPQQDDELAIGSALSTAGTWEIATTQTVNTCGFFNTLENVILPLEIDSRGPSAIDTLGDCRTFDLRLALPEGSIVEENEFRARDCVVTVETEVVVRYDRTTFLGSELNRIRYVSGDCEEFRDECVWGLESRGERCEDCEFRCDDFPEFDSRFGSMIGWAFDVGIEDLLRAFESEPDGTGVRIDTEP